MFNQNASFFSSHIRLVFLLFYLYGIIIFHKSIGTHGKDKYLSVASRGPSHDISMLK